MKKLFGKSGETLVEVVLSIAIFAVIALPLFSVFEQSIKADRTASDILNSNYISQDYIEKLDSTTYSGALSNIPTKKSVGGFYLTASIRPYGTVNSFLGGQCSYLHLVMFSGGNMLAVMPDGKWNMFSSIPSSMSLSLSNSVYSFTGDTATITGSSPYGYCALIVNAMNKPSTTKSAVTLSASCKAVVYCPDGHAGDISISPVSSGDIFVNIIKGDTSLIHVTSSVYVLSTDANPVSSSESYINIKNW